MLLRYTFVVLLMLFLSFEAVPLGDHTGDQSQDPDDNGTLDNDSTQENFNDCWANKYQEGGCVAYFRCNYTAPDDDVDDGFEVSSLKAIVSSSKKDECTVNNYLHICCPLHYIIPETKVSAPNQAVTLPKLK